MNYIILSETNSRELPILRNAVCPIASEFTGERYNLTPALLNQIAYFYTGQ
jgi:hypothetical protein